MFILLVSYFKTQFALMGFFAMTFTMAMRQIDVQFENQALPVPIEPQEQVLPAEEDE